MKHREFYVDDMIDQGLCPECHGKIEIEVQNEGYSAPDPTFCEITNIYCPDCGWTIKDEKGESK